jgi:hypothetical protein
MSLKVPSITTSTGNSDHIKNRTNYFSGHTNQHYPIYKREKEDTVAVIKGVKFSPFTS